MWIFFHHFMRSSGNNGVQPQLIALNDLVCELVRNNLNTRKIRSVRKDVLFKTQCYSLNHSLSVRTHANNSFSAHYLTAIWGLQFNQEIPMSPRWLFFWGGVYSLCIFPSFPDSWNSSTKSLLPQNVQGCQTHGG